MKSILSIACLAGASTVSGLALANTPNELTWTGEVIPGQGPVTFAGDAKSIYRQIREANPEYKPAKRSAAVGSTPPMAPRLGLNPILPRENPSPVSTDYTCAYGVLVDVAPIDVGIKDLYNIGSGTCNAPAGAPGAGGCTRLTCSDNASIWLCNDNDFAVEIPCTLIADNAVQLLIECQTTTYAGDNTWDSTVRGQVSQKSEGRGNGED
ncbi:hypothetical protein SBRCBS47491_002509 [Sporothrix bragantina]|uniref:Cyanovirin-N domain-containing protein n=1 Tax=Sporothrix bragantina TaxID=671064 RepID=A0ABP0B7N2_9PEZI